MKIFAACFAFAALTASAVAQLRPAAAPAAPATPDLHYRWVYMAINLQVNENVPKMEATLRRAKAAGYNGAVLADYKLNILDRVPENYFANIAHVKKTANELGIHLYPTVMPFGYSNGLLAHNPNLAEGLPVKNAPFVVRGQTADIAPPAAPLLPNGDFEQTTKPDTFAGFNFHDAPGMVSFADRAVFHGGQQSLRFDRPAGAVATNVRIMQEVMVEPYRQMHLSVWIRTKNFESHGQVQMTTLPFDNTPEDKARGDAPSLCYNSWQVAQTQDWTEYHAVFNTLGHRKIGVYVGAWGARGGSMWLDDMKLEPVGLLNVLRCDGCPLTVSGSNGTVYTERRDFEPVADSRLGNVPYAGEYEIYHTPPPLTLTPNSRIKEGETLKVSYYHPVVLGSGQVCASLVNPATLQAARDMTARVEKVLTPPGYFLSQDEIRTIGWTDEKGATGKTAGQLLAQNTIASSRIIAEIASGRKPEQFIWSDMYDPFHNARPRYYLANGPLTGSWEGLSRDMIVVNWNSDKPKDSLGFFAERGNRQILAGYYDGTPDSIKSWLKAVSELPDSGRVVGVMYTTWANRYDDLEAFARAAWGAAAPAK